MIIYLIGALVSAVVWFLLIKFRQGGFYIRMPEKRMGYFLDPLDKGYVNYSSVMVGWLIMTFAWPVGWFVLVMVYLVAVLMFIIKWLFCSTVGNDNFLHKVFGVKK